MAEKMMTNKALRVSAVVLSIALHMPLLAQAKVSPEEAAKLGTVLTPFGAERQGDAAKGIPDWEGGLKELPSGYKGAGSFHVDPFPDEKPLRVIDSQNMANDVENLSPGVQALLKSYPSTFKIPVYPSHRSAAAPEDIYRNTRRNAETATLVEGGNGLSGAYAGIPFPIPGDGHEAIWNHITRWQGRYIDEIANTAQVTTRGQYSLIRERMEMLSNYYDPSKSVNELGNVLQNFMSELLPPSREAGRKLLVRDFINQVEEPRAAWVYMAGQRRVRRAPTLAYDTPNDGIYADDTDMFNGATDRYDWKLIGKQALVVPYHNYAMEQAGLPLEKLIMPGHLNPEFTRWEMHRVWVVEATLRSGSRHVHAKRRFYLDEDSWYALMVENYDSRGSLWHVSLAFSKNAYDVPVITPVNVVYHDLNARTYTAIGLRNNEKTPRQFPSSAPPAGYWTPATLRRTGTQ